LNLATTESSRNVPTVGLPPEPGSIEARQLEILQHMYPQWTITCVTRGARHGWWAHRIKILRPAQLAAGMMPRIGFWDFDDFSRTLNEQDDFSGLSLCAFGLRPPLFMPA
jgi:hypothetical protein